MAALAGGGDSRAREPGRVACRQEDGLALPLGRAVAGGLGGLAAAEPQDHPRRQLLAPEEGLGIHPALKAPPGLRVDPEAAGGQGDRLGVKERGLKKDAAGGLRHTRLQPAHDAADSDRPPAALAVGDDEVALAEPVLVFVQGEEGLACPRAADGQVSLQLVGIKDVERAAEVEGEVVGEIHQGRDRLGPRRLQPAQQPRRGAVVPFHPEEAPAHGGGEVGLLAFKGAPPRDGACEGGRGLVGRQGAQAPEAGGGEFAGNAAHGEAVPPVGGDGEVEDRLIAPRRLQVRCANGDGGVGGI